MEQKYQPTFLITCLNRMIGNCFDCKKDYNPKHHPNNRDCPNYHEIKIRTFKVK